MLKILNTKQIKAWDSFTIENEPVSSIDLMERACLAFIRWFTEKFDPLTKVGIVCGTGNNGGDGLGIARLLSEWGYPVSVWIVRGVVLESDDFKINKSRLSQKVIIRELTQSPKQDEFKDQQVLVDALFGSGLSRPLEGIYADTVDVLNKSDAVRVAVDIPSGLYADSHSEGIILQAHHTVTFQAPKLSFFMPENSNFVGDWTVVDIGLSKKFSKEAESDCFLVTRKSLRKIFEPRKRFAHKGDYGKALLIAGSYGKMGAAVLAARAALRTGLGLLTVCVPQKGYEIIQTSVPEAMTMVDPDDQFFSMAPESKDFTVVGIGPGLGQDKKSRQALTDLLTQAEQPLVIDADGLNLLAAHRELLTMLPPNSVLTPHPGEFRRLAGDWKNDFERLDLARNFARQAKCILVLKGAFTTTVSPEGQVYFNHSGNPGMAKGGSGDVLTGILTGLMAQTLPPLQAALAGVYLHGLAADLALPHFHEQGLIASDIVDYLPAAFNHLLR